jgi:hypothetical protein
MITNPRKNQPVQVWYGQKTRDVMPMHGKFGTVVVANNKRGGPRNHGVEIGGKVHVIPAGNMRIPR